MYLFPSLGRSQRPSWFLALGETLTCGLTTKTTTETHALVPLTWHPISRHQHLMADLALLLLLLLLLEKLQGLARGEEKMRASGAGDT